ncbi:FkbM family methyltransferase [Yoonia sp. GPGPB17]|uniref:FkbM family methyltransferase n=1 Tax=Yoonia sp. GPGPB17 TaxID=3026147 RepID=UPI0030C09557
MKITNPFSGLPFHLLSYTHKGYWFYGKHRETATMQRLARLTGRGDTVFEVGGHIGYLAQFFAKKVGHTGQIHVFEPGQENQHFLRKNIARCMQCVHINAAVSDHTGKATFYEENLGGFMNSLDANFAASSDIASAQRNRLQVRARKVNTVTLDSYATAHNVWPTVLKIDAEGAELAVLRGAAQVLEHARSVMIEVSRHQRQVFEILDDHEFTLSQPDGTLITDPMQMDGNVFATRVA